MWDVENGFSIVINAIKKAEEGTLFNSALKSGIHSLKFYLPWYTEIYGNVSTFQPEAS